MIQGVHSLGELPKIDSIEYANSKSKLIGFTKETFAKREIALKRIFEKQVKLALTYSFTRYEKKLTKDRLQISLELPPAEGPIVNESLAVFKRLQLDGKTYSQAVNLLVGKITDFAAANYPDYTLMRKHKSPLYLRPKDLMGYTVEEGVVQKVSQAWLARTPLEFRYAKASGKENKLVLIMSMHTWGFKALHFDGTIRSYNYASVLGTLRERDEELFKTQRTLMFFMKENKGIIEFSSVLKTETTARS